MNSTLNRNREYAVYTVFSFTRSITNTQNNSSYCLFLWRRTAAFLYDCLLLIAVFFIVTGIAISINDGQAITHPVFKLMLYGIGFMFFDWFWRHGGQTLGMRAWHIRLVNCSSDSNNNLPTHKQCLQRYLCGTLLFGLTLIYSCFNKHGRAWHDLLSNTKIIIKIK